MKDENEAVDILPSLCAVQARFTQASRLMKGTKEAWGPLEGQVRAIEARLETLLDEVRFRNPVPPSRCA